jgi:hypothetical protein
VNEDIYLMLVAERPRPLAECPTRHPFWTSRGAAMGGAFPADRALRSAHRAVGKGNKKHRKHISAMGVVSPSIASN